MARNCNFSNCLGGLIKDITSTFPAKESMMHLKLRLFFPPECDKELISSPAPHNAVLSPFPSALLSILLPLGHWPYPISPQARPESMLQAWFSGPPS